MPVFKYATKEERLAARRAAYKKYRETHPERYRANQDRWRKKNKPKLAELSRRRRAELLAEIKQVKSRPCMDCGGSFPPCCMDFDHREGEEKHPKLSYTGKKVPISMSSLGLSSPEAFRAEVDKCDLVCANCHRIRTWERRHGQRITGDHKLDETKL